MEQESQRAMQQAVDILTRQVVARTPVDRGIHRNSIQNEVRTGPFVTGIVMSPLASTPAVEFGRKPGRMPPSDVIELWARRHGMAGLGYVIARAIGRRGTKGAFMFKKGLEASKTSIDAIWQRLPQRLKDLFE